MLLAAETMMTVVVWVGGLLVLAIGFATAFSKFYRKPGPEEAIVRTGVRGLTVVTGKGMIVVPLIQEAQTMDLSVKRIEIAREGEDGLICKDNIRADIRVAYYVRVNNQTEDIKTVAEMINPKRASEISQLRELFEAKFSEALKTVGKQFEFVNLYTDRDNFRDKILAEIGTDLNGYRLDNCHIDYLEQTPLELLSPRNILDAEGIKKITELTTQENIKRNHFEVEEAKTIKKQNVERDEALYELEKQRVDAQEKQKREIAEIIARNEAEARKVEQEQRLKAERARIATDEEVRVAEENKDRQIIVAMRNKERTDKVEIERVEKDRALEAVERERAVGVSDIEKDKAIEVEKRNIQEVIRERVIVERGVVEEQENIKNTEEFMTADRDKRVAITLAEKDAQEALVKEVKKADAAKQAAEFGAEQVIIEAEAKRGASEKEMQATKMLAEAKTADHAAIGLGDAQVTVAKAGALEKHGTAEANVIQKKFSAEAIGIEEKANAMKLFDAVGKDHEEFKLKLNKDKDIEIAAIQAQRQIAEAQSRIVGEALKTARIDIVGGETEFFDKIVDAVKGGKAVDRFVDNSNVLTDVKNTFFNGNPQYFQDKLQQFASQFGMSFEDAKDLSIAAFVGKMLVLADSDEARNGLKQLLETVKGAGIGERKVSSLKMLAGEAAKSTGRGPAK